MTTWYTRIAPTCAPTPEQWAVAMARDSKRALQNYMAVFAGLPAIPHVTCDDGALSLLRSAYRAGTRPAANVDAGLVKSLLRGYGAVFVHELVALARMLPCDPESPPMEQVSELQSRFPGLMEHLAQMLSPTEHEQLDLLHHCAFGTWPAITPLHTIVEPLARWVYTPIQRATGDAMPGDFCLWLGHALLAKLAALLFGPAAQAELDSRERLAAEIADALQAIHV